MRRFCAVLALLLLVVAGCGNDDGGAAGGPTRTLRVFAAASLTDAMEEVGDAFGNANPGVRVEFNFGPSSGLREQILGGAPADVFASANPANMDQLVDAAAAIDPQEFASNILEIAVPPGNPAGVTSLMDLGRAELLLGLCAEEVPCGQFGRQALAAAGVNPALDTNAPDVRALLTQIESGDLDAGVVYRTDVIAAAGAVEGVAIPGEHNVVARYPIAVLREAVDGQLAKAFVTFVLSPQGQEILAAHGFGPP